MRGFKIFTIYTLLWKLNLKDTGKCQRVLGNETFPLAATFLFYFILWFTSGHCCCPVASGQESPWFNTKLRWGALWLPPTDQMHVQYDHNRWMWADVWFVYFSLLTLVSAQHWVFLSLVLLLLSILNICISLRKVLIDPDLLCNQ